MFLHAIQTVIMPGAKKKCSESEVKVHLDGWTLYKASKESHNILNERPLILISGANFERRNAV
jgi:hypothetical protein